MAIYSRYLFNKLLSWCCCVAVAMLVLSSYQISPADNSKTMITSVVKLSHESEGRRSTSRPLPRLPLSYRQEEAVKVEMLKVQNEMAGYNFSNVGGGNYFKVDDLIMEKGGQPIKSLLLATWRTGSKFISFLLHPTQQCITNMSPSITLGKFKYDESLMVHDGKLGREALQVVEGILSCNYFDIPRFDKLMDKMSEGVIYTNKRVAPYKNGKNSVSVWRDPNFFSAMCRLSPFLLIKTVRLRLSVGKELLKSTKHENLRMILLVRDPRAVIQSRLHKPWCKKGRDCYDVERLCMEMEEDFKHAEIVRRKYPDRFLALRYEDISLHPNTAPQKIFKFLRLQFHPNVQQFVKDHTTSYAKGFVPYKPKDYTIERDSRKHTFHWKANYFKGNFSRVLEIQSKCSKAMELWGYSNFTDRDQLNSSFMPLLSPPWPEMVVEVSKKLNVL